MVTRHTRETGHDMGTITTTTTDEGALFAHTTDIVLDDRDRAVQLGTLDFVAKCATWDGFEYAVQNVLVGDGDGIAYGVKVGRTVYRVTTVYRRIDRRNA